MTLGITLFCYWFVLWLLKKFKPEPSFKLHLTLLVLITPLVIYPFVYSPVWWLRGLIGDLSITSLLLLVSAVHQQLFGQFLIRDTERKPLEIGVVVLGLCLYPFALGLGEMDPYALGYASPWLIGGLVMIAAFGLVRQFQAIPLMMMLALAAWNMQLLQSVNLWDYVIDPFIFFFYLGRLVKKSIKSMKHAS